MNHIDIVLIAFVLLPGLLGLWRGMLWPIAVTVGVVVGAITGLVFGPLLAEAFLPEAAWAPLAGGALLFVLVFSLVQGLRWLLRKILAALKLRWVDHVAGGLAAAAAGAIAGSWLITGVGMILPDKPPAYASSLLSGHAEAIACASGMPCDGDGPGNLFDDSLLPDVKTILESLPDALPLKSDGSAGEPPAPSGGGDT